MYVGASAKLAGKGVGLAGSYNWFPIQQLGLAGTIGGDIGSVLKKRYCSYRADLLLWYEPIAFLDQIKIQLGVGGTGVYEQLELAKGIGLKGWNYGVKGASRLLFSISDSFFLTGQLAQAYRIRKHMGHWKWEACLGFLVKN